MLGEAPRRTLAEKVWDAHVVRSADGEPDLLYIDLHLLHEVTSPQAFDGLRMAGRPVRRRDLTIATEDHNTPTDNLLTIADPVSRTQIETLRRNCAEFGIRLHSLGDAQQGIVHVIGPQLGLTQPGLTIVCGDSHTSTHGAFGALAFGIGTSEVEHVLATQTLPQRRPGTKAITVDGDLPPGLPAKDVILGLIGRMGLTAGTAIRDIAVDTVFLGSCTNGRLEDLRAAAAVLQGRHVAAGVRALVVPGSMQVKAAAEAEGLHEVFTAAGFEWREAGCSMCLGMNPDTLSPGERCASTSNRNFEGRQGPGGRTHLVSPGVAAATAVAGRFTSPADL